MPLLHQLLFSIVKVLLSTKLLKAVITMKDYIALQRCINCAAMVMYA